MSRSVLIYVTHPPFATQLEVAQRHLLAGDRVTVMGCDAELLTCNWNQQYTADRCAKCRATRRVALSRLDRPVDVVPSLHLTDADRAELRGVPRTFPDVAALKAYRVDEFDAGMATLSTLIDKFRDPALDVTAHPDLVYAHLLPSVAVFRSVQNYLAANRVDRVYLFNGRYNHTRPVLRASQSRGVEFAVLEEGCNKSHYTVWENCTPHGRKSLQDDIAATWERGAGDPAERERVARAWFDTRSKGQEVHDRDIDRSYVTGQRPDLLPDGFDPAAHNVAVFNSSEDEWAAIGDEWAPTVYPNQLAGLTRLAADLPRLGSHVRVYLRCHPHLANTPMTAGLLRLSSPNLTIIPPDSPVSSYALLRACRTALTFGSTVGIEAVYFGKPSVLANCAAYDHLGGTYNAGSHEEVLDLIARPLDPKPVEPALVYAYYYATYGIPFRHYRKADEMYKEGTLNGRTYLEPVWSRAAWGVTRRLPLVMAALNDRHRRHGYERLLGPDGKVG